MERLLQLLLFAEMQLALRYLLIQFMLQKMLIQDGVNKGQLVHNLPLYQKYEIIFLSKHKKGPRLGSKKVAFLIHCDTKTVRYWWAHWKETKDLSDELKPGRPRLKTAREDETIMNESEEDERTTSVSITRGLKRKKWKLVLEQFGED